MAQSGRCILMSMNLLNWGMYGPVAESKVHRVRGLVADLCPDVVCLSEVGPGDAIEQLTTPLARINLIYSPISIGLPNQRGIRNVILGRERTQVLDANLKVPQEIELPPISLDNFSMGAVRIKVSRETLAVLVRADGHTLAIGFFHPKSKMAEDIKTGKLVTEAPDQTYLGLCKMVASLRNFGQCLLARQWVDRFWEYNPLKIEWNVKKEEVRFALVGDWNANPQEEQRMAIQGYSDAGLPAETVLLDGIGKSSTDLADICTISWAGGPNSFDAILVDQALARVAEARVIPAEAVDLFGYAEAERERLENEVLDHCPVGLFLKQ